MMRQYMDASVDPCADFYTYACGGWARAHPIPPDKTVFDTFEMLREMLDAALRVELERPDADPTAPPPAPAPAPTSTPTPEAASKEGRGGGPAQPHLSGWVEELRPAPHPQGSLRKIKTQILGQPNPETKGKKIFLEHILRPTQKPISSLPDHFGIGVKMTSKIIFFYPWFLG